MQKKSFNQLKYLKINNIPEGSIYTVRNNDIEEMAEQFNLNYRLYTRVFGRFKKSKERLVFTVYI